MEHFEDIAARLIDDDGYNVKDVVCFNATNLHELLPETEGGFIFEERLKLITTDDKAEIRARFQATKKANLGSWKFTMACQWRIIQGLILVEQHGLAYPNVTPLAVTNGHIQLNQVTGWEAACELAKHYEFEGQPQDAAAMWEVLLTKRIGDCVLGIIGDDRDQSYYAYATYAPKRFCQAFFNDDEGGAFI